MAEVHPCPRYQEFDPLGDIYFSAYMALTAISIRLPNFKFPLLSMGVLELFKEKITRMF